MNYSIDPELRAAFVSGLRDLADFLVANPEVPVPLHARYPTFDVRLSVDGDDEQQHTEMERLTGLLQVDVDYGIHAHAIRKFGPVHLDVIGIPKARMRDYAARASYTDIVIVDEGQAT